MQVEEAIKLKPDETQAHIILALILRELGQKELAVERFESLLRTNPRCGNLYYQIAMLEPKQELVPGVEKLLRDPDLPIGDSIFCNFALGNIHRGSKSYDQAFDHFLKANALYRKTYLYDAKENSLLIDSLITVYSKRFFQTKRQWGSASQLPVFVLGMPRSGTTLVEQIISSHMSVHGAGELQAMPAIKLTIAQRLEHANPYPECMSLFDKKMAEEYSERYLQELALHCPSATHITDKLPGNYFKIGLIKTYFEIVSSHTSLHGAGELQAMPAIKLTIAQRLEHANPYPECMSLFDKKMAEEYSERYLQELALHCPSATHITDKLPGNYFKIGLIKTLFPDARVIHCQRNPLDSCISIFFHCITDWKWSFDLTELGQYYLDYQRLMTH